MSKFYVDNWASKYWVLVIHTEIKLKWTSRLVSVFSIDYLKSLYNLIWHIIYLFRLKYRFTFTSHQLVVSWRLSGPVVHLHITPACGELVIIWPSGSPSHHTSLWLVGDYLAQWFTFTSHQFVVSWWLSGRVVHLHITPACGELVIIWPSDWGE